MLQRLKKELEMLEMDPPPNISAWPNNDKLNEFTAQIEGPDDSPYANGIFKLSIKLNERYPFEPPNIRFITPIYHPNIDNAGRICLDTLKMPPKGSWTPSLNISTVLTTIRLLMGDPNPDDGLMVEITDEYKYRKHEFDKKARESTEKYAKVNEINNINMNNHIDDEKKQDESKKLNKKRSNDDSNNNNNDDVNNKSSNKRIRIRAPVPSLDDDSDSESD